MKNRVKRHAIIQPLDPSYRLIPLTQRQNAIVDTSDFEWLNSTGYKGVTFDKDLGKWRVWFRGNGIRKYLGCFTSIKEAAKAYDVEAVKCYGHFAHLNFTVEEDSKQDEL